MTLSTGNKSSGFTFVEVMVAMVILAAGIVAVYRSFFLCVDYLNNIATRWWANELIEDKIMDVTRLLKESNGALISTGEPTRTITVNHRPIIFHYSVELIPLNDLQGMFKMNVAHAWKDGSRPMHINRSLYLLK